MKQYHSPGHQRLRELSALLRSPDTWPDRFVWNFKNIEKRVSVSVRRYGLLGLLREYQCRTAGCALGLHRLVSPYVRAHTTTETGTAQAYNLAEVYELPEQTAREIFLAKNNAYPVEMDYITPAMVADKIDKYLAKVP